eukprot:TRINITY_DN13399_c0_g1::TRINITY_DN13399_c0_g1_i1::g.9551::m.9551 TRINITY_DN13399_c0_g1::TRINITY_DN13399_c0_g1_i1::g.9551  ORF type:complete len:221 (-),score=29.66,sp/Q5R833/ACO13_PONAB/39.68/6e-24,4HBT/PF03061.17/7.5e-18,4HBT_3/PF13622.1/6.9e+03,4HBT_3/PF13622.1/8.6e-05,DUF4442/PF14539.1/0.0029,4HBT_2/PF13279.1/0.23 TRINITY_DN13399_c0_g1_i1:336-935(-)
MALRVLRLLSLPAQAMNIGQRSVYNRIPAQTQGLLACQNQSRFLSTGEKKHESIVDMGKKAFANLVLKKLTEQDCFDDKLKALRIDTIGNGEVVCVLPVTASLSNRGGTLHGGCTATLVDLVTTIAVMTLDPKKPGVSTDLNVSYLRAVKVGDEISIHARVLKTGKQLVFTEAEIYRTSDKAMIAKGLHTKAYSSSTSS